MSYFCVIFYLTGFERRQCPKRCSEVTSKSIEKAWDDIPGKLMLTPSACFNQVLMEKPHQICKCPLSYTLSMAMDGRLANMLTLYVTVHQTKQPKTNHC